MSRNKNKRLQKVRRYRDKLIERITNLETEIRKYVQILKEVRAAARNSDLLRVATLAIDDTYTDEALKDFTPINQLAAELALVYRMLNVEREFSAQMRVAADQRDYLRVAALAAEHNMESKAHDDMLSRWSRDHGFTRILREEAKDADVT